MKTEFKVGDKVYCSHVKCEGLVTCTNRDSEIYPIIVTDSKGHSRTYTADGRLYSSQEITLTKIENEMTQPTKEQILEAAGTSTQAKEALKKLYPTLFPEDKSVIVTNNSWNKIICESLCGEYAGKSFYLDNGFNWEIKKDSRGDLRLVPTKK